MTSYELLRDSALFGRLGEADLQALSQAATLRVFERGDVLVQYGTPQDEIFYIAHGSVLLYRRNGRRDVGFLLGILRAPSLFGDAECMARSLWLVSARAKDAGVCLKIPNTAFLQALARSEQLTRRLYVDSCVRHLLANHTAQTAALYGVRVGILRLLLDYAECFGEVLAERAVVPEPMPQAELARALGVNRRTIERTMKTLIDEGVIRWLPDDALAIERLPDVQASLPRPLFGLSSRLGDSVAPLGGEN